MIEREKEEVRTVGAVPWFHRLWDSIYGKDPAKCWAGNPFVWCVEFERIEGYGK